MSNLQNSNLLSNIKERKMKTLMKSTALLILLLVITSNTLAQPGYGWRQQYFHEKLNLTDTQEQKITSLRDEHQKKMIDLRAQLQKEQLELKSLYRNKDLDRNKLLAAEDKVSKLRDEMRKAAINHQMDVYSLLDDNQKAIWRDKFDNLPQGKFNNNWKGKRGGRGFNGDCPYNGFGRRGRF